MNKSIKLFLVLVLMMFLTGCASVNISVKVEPDFTSVLEYQIDFDTKNLSENEKIQIIQFFDTTAKSYETNGFEYRKSMNDSTLEFNLSLKKKNKNYSEAYTQIENWLTDPEISFFSEISLYSEAESYEQLFVFEIKSDFDKIIQTSTISTLPKNLETKIVDSINESTITMNISLPRSTVVETSSDLTVEQSSSRTLFSKQLSLIDSDSFKVIARSSIENDKLASQDIDQSLSEVDNKIKTFQTLKTISIILASISFVMFIIKNKAKKS